MPPVVLQLLNVLQGHPIVLGIFCLFLMLQVGCSLVFRTSLGRMRKPLRELAERGILPAVNEEARDQVPWVDWVCDQVGTDSAPGSLLPRDVALNEFDHRLASHKSYLLLQRTAIMAPLLGVLITATGFLLLELPEQSEQAGRILQALTPLILGVGAGALLAFINQLLLHFADTRADRLHELAREWFDGAIGNHQLDDSGASTAHLLSEAATSILAAAEQNQNVAQVVKLAGEQLNRASTELGSVYQDLTAGTKALPQQMAQLTEASSETTKSLTTLPALITGMLASFQSTVDSFRNACDQQFVPLSEQQHLTAQQLAKSSTAIAQALQDIGTSADELKDIIHCQAESTRAYEATMSQYLVPQQQFIQEAVDRIEETTKTLGEPLVGLTGQLQQLTDRLQIAIEATDLIEQAAMSFSSAVDDKFSPAAELHHNLLKQVQQTAQHTSEATRTLTEATTQLTEAAAQHQNSADQLCSSIELHSVPAHKLLERATINFDATAESLSEHADRLNTSFESTAKQLGQVHAQMKLAMDSITSAGKSLEQAVSESFQPASEQQKALLIQVEAITKQLGQSVSDLQQGSQRWSEISESHSQTQQDLRSAAKESHAANQHLANAGSQLDDVIKNQMQPTQQEFVQTAKALHGSIDQLTQLMSQGVSPVTKRLTELDQSLVNIQNILEHLKPLTAASQESERFLQGMAQAAQLADALKNLPERLEKVISNGLNGQTPKPNPKKKWYSGWSKS